MFVDDGAAFVIGAGAAREIVVDGETKVAVDYSADRSKLLVTEERESRRVVLVAPIGAAELGAVALDFSGGSTLGEVRVARKPARLYYSVYGAPDVRLVVSALASGSEPTTLATQGAFSGEFDVDATGAIAYTGSGQNPATVMLRTAAGERPLAAGLATAFTPAFSRDGARVCFTGSEQAGGPIAVWTVDRDSGETRVVPGTAGLKPTSPVFSPDGARIAFRSATDGSVWIAPLGGGEPLKLDVTCDEAPIAW